MDDETHFSLRENINFKRCVYWHDENPHGVVPGPLHEAKVAVLCGITSTFISTRSILLHRGHVNKTVHTHCGESCLWKPTFHFKCSFRSYKLTTPTPLEGP
ncbi:hypothetical protein TNIN_134151 [Trichonephila inaurata madagascariensis]|uniref:Uncharacterized protein n=1 Tax=Trichonephila inaurata madagascariensis TaxID=2747483 RepID=A0A8X6ICN6_9ARAC|nr:hypothetical protein TNIN_134151 [Trichonephila inaurata madagascariensis]